MNDNTAAETTPTTEIDQVETATPTEPENQPADSSDAGLSAEPKATAEAAKYRRQLREAQAERDALKESLAAIRRQSAETALTGALDKPASLWLTGVNVDDYFRDDGTLDATALLASANAARRDHGLASPVRFKGSADQGTRGLGRSRAGTWQDALRG